MEQLAGSGTTFITEDAFKLTEGLFRFEALGANEVKGKEESVNVYQVITTSSRRTRFDVNAERGLTLLVGRGRELEILVDGFETVKTGRGQAFSIVAEAGGGKSRLLYEFRKAISNEVHTVLEGKCLSYAGNIAYLPIMDIIRAGFDLQESDNLNTVRLKLETGLDAIKADKKTIVPYLLELLSMEDTGIDPSLSTQAIREGISESLIKIVGKQSEIRPLIMIIEDLHWIDQNSDLLIRDLLDIVPGIQLLLIFTHRPEYQEKWSRKSYFNQINLHRFSSRESNLMLSHLLGQSDIAADLQDLVLEKTAGIPFFMEEFMKSMIDLEILEKKDGQFRLSKEIAHITVPSTIQDVIMARVDTLPEKARDLVHKGAVIEREFSYALIKQVSDLPEEELLAQLSILTDSELIYERGFPPEVVYIFKHSLTRELIYDSILPARKRVLHENIGQAVEKLYQEDIGEYYGILANHFIASENLEKGEFYSRAAAKKAQKQSDYNSAIFYTQKRISSIEKIPQGHEQQQKLINARISLGRYYIQMNYHAEAKEAVDPIVDLVETQGDKKKLSLLNTIIGSYYSMVENNFDKGCGYIEEAVKLAEEENDIAAMSMSNLFLGSGYTFICKFEKALQGLEKALSISKTANNIYGTAQIMGMISFQVYSPTGKLDLAYQTSEEAVRLAEESGDPHTKALAFIGHGRSNYYKGFLEQAIKFFDKGAEFCERINHQAWGAASRIELAGIYITLREYNEAILQSEKLEELFATGRIQRDKNVILLMIDSLKILDQSKEPDLSELKSKFQGVINATNKATVQPLVAEALIKSNPPQYDAAKEWIQNSIATLEEHNYKGLLWKPYVLYSELYKRQNNLPQAREQMNKAIDIMKECSADGWVDRYEKELAELN